MIIVFAVLFAASVVLAAAEAALLRVSRAAVAVQTEQGDRRANRLLAQLDDLPKIVNSILLAVLLVQLGAATVTGVLADRWFGGLGITLATLVLTVVLFVYSEAIPKTYAVRQPLRVARALSRTVSRSSSRVLRMTSVLVLARRARSACFQVPSSRKACMTAARTSAVRFLDTPRL